MTATPPATQYPNIEWTDSHGHAFSLSCGPLSNGEVRFDLNGASGKDGPELFCANLTRAAAADIMRRILEALNAMSDA